MKMDSRVAVAFLLGVGAFVLLFVLGEPVSKVSTVSAARNIHAIVFIIGIGGYFFISEYFLSRGHPQAIWKDWPMILALNAPLVLTTIITLLVEPNKLAVVLPACAAALGVACSCVGAALAARTAAQPGS